MLSRFSISLLLAGSLLPVFLYAQTQHCPNTESPSNNEAQRTKITITAIEFDPGSQIPESLRPKLTQDAQPADLFVAPGEPDDDWVNIPSNAIRQTLQSQGYFRVVVEATPILIRAEAKKRFYVLRINVDSGPQYQLGEIRFENAKLFSSTELRKAFPLQRGDLLDVSKIRQGIESITRLYGGKGHTLLIPELETTIQEDPKKIVDVLIKIDEGVQYRIGSLDMLGLPKKAEDLLMSQLQPGSVFDLNLFNTLLKENPDLFENEAIARKHTQMKWDSKSATVAIILDFRCQPKSQ
jgi:outer membrane protein assembly factor BamA